MEDLLSALRQGKALPERHPDTDNVLSRIMRLDLTGWNEEEVRAEIIDPLARILGYDIETWASLKRERSLPVMGASKAVDYSMMLFAQNFWLIEAKRPGDDKAFSRDAIYQTLRYAAHPDINAALMLLCDGSKFAVFDREVSLDEPLLTIKRDELAARFDELRWLLAPWQVFFFEKRRVLRLIDKVFDQETHLSRLEEMRREVDGRLASKRAVVLDNWRQRVKLDEHNADYLEWLRASGAAELVETAFFLEHPVAGEKMLMQTLLDEAGLPSPLLGTRILPERPRSANGAFWVHALHFLAGVDERGIETIYLPGWLGHSPSSALQRLIPLLLTGLAGEPERQVIMLYAAAARRISKLKMLIDPGAQAAGQLMHALTRFLAPELSLAQASSSPGGQMLRTLDSRELVALDAFVRKHTNDKGRFQLASASQDLKEAWRAERQLLADIPDVSRLLKERNLDDLGRTETNAVAQDWMGHAALCVLDWFPKWKEWVLAEHPMLVVELAQAGSWQARAWLGLESSAVMEALPDGWLDDRLFLEDRETGSALRSAYSQSGR